MFLDSTGLLQLIEGKPTFNTVIQGLNAGYSRVTLPQSAKPYLIAALYQTLKRPMLVITAYPENAKRLYEQVFTWCNSENIRLLPQPDTLPYQRVVSDASTGWERLQAISSLVNPENGASLVITSIPGLIQKITPYTDFVSACHTIEQGTRIEPLQLMDRWGRIGYGVETIVEIPGTVSHRGGILDIYPPASKFPVRLEFLGNTIESIRTFDPVSQRSLSRIDKITVCPAAEVLSGENTRIKPILEKFDLTGCKDEVCRRLEQEKEMLLNGQRPRDIQFYAALFNNDNILSYLPRSGILIADEPDLLSRVTNDFASEAEELRIQRTEQGELPPDYPRPYFTWEEIEPFLGNHVRLDFAEFGVEDTGIISSGFARAPGYAGQLPVFIDKVKGLLKQKKRVILTSYQAARLEELLDEAGIFAAPVSEVKSIPSLPSLTLLKGSLEEGWTLNNETFLFTDAEIFGFVKQYRITRKHPVQRHKLYADFVPGDYVVHVEHGIGKFTGVVTMGGDSGQKEYMVLQYAAGDRLYVPTDQIDRVSRYIGSKERPPVLTKLGTQEWSLTKRRVKEAVENVAKDLLALYAAREVIQGFAVSKDGTWQQEFEASFPYVETPDQLEALSNVKRDMEKPRPMDRLLCGDVGYGKTEIAVRAAFKVVMDGKQVAMLVPTTILAQQHYTTFQKRMEAFPVKVEMLSRFRSQKEQKAIIEGLVNGSIDICIGTHRLIQKDVVFKNLGLLIIDEEQRFGVAHKEYIKKKKKDVHVLTLSATPIPRTLNMALVGVRDMSTMETPPEDRLPIKTYIAEYDDRLVREAIIKELERNGQVFFVHNRVQTIHQTAARLRVLVPEAKISVAHGQMGEHELEKVMFDFILGNNNVLICSTIIESGIDMPNVNTLIINRADRFGLSQLYQLRGRIGRGTNHAYAYLLFDKNKNLSPAAQKRLQTIYEATELGAGFGIAMKDMEIRGAGSLLGLRQSGFISAVGFDLYTRLLGEAVEELKAKQEGIKGEKPGKSKLPLPSIDLPFSAFIPDSYVADIDTRLSLYECLVKAGDVEKVELLTADLKDRFGPPPEEVKNLLFAVKLKMLAAGAFIESISTESGQIVVRRFQGMPLTQDKLKPVVRDGVKSGITHLYVNPKRVRSWQRVLEEVIRRAR